MSAGLSRAAADELKTTVTKAEAVSARGRRLLRGEGPADPGRPVREVPRPEEAVVGPAAGQPRGRAQGGRVRAAVVPAKPEESLLDPGRRSHARRTENAARPASSRTRRSPSCDNGWPWVRPGPIARAKARREAGVALPPRRPRSRTGLFNPSAARARRRRTTGNGSPRPSMHSSSPGSNPPA